MVRISTSTPISRREAWMISAIFLRSSLPWLVISSKAKGLPFFTRMPSALRSVQPASARRARARWGSYG